MKTITTTNLFNEIKSIYEATILNNPKTEFSYQEDLYKYDCYSLTKEIKSGRYIWFMKDNNCGTQMGNLDFKELVSILQGYNPKAKVYLLDINNTNEGTIKLIKWGKLKNIKEKATEYNYQYYKNYFTTVCKVPKFITNELNNKYYFNENDIIKVTYDYLGAEQCELKIFKNGLQIYRHSGKMELHHYVEFKLHEKKHIEFEKTLDEWCNVEI